MEKLSPVFIVHVVILCEIRRDYLRLVFSMEKTIKPQDYVIVFFRPFRGLLGLVFTFL